MLQLDEYYFPLTVSGGSVNLQEKTATPTTSSQEISFDDGYDGLEKVTINGVTSAIDSNITANNIKLGVSILGVAGNVEPDKPDQSKTATPTTSSQTITPDTGYELASVTINGVTSAIDSNIVAGNIKKDITILGVTGTVEEGGNYQSKTATPTTSQQTITPDANYDALSQVTVGAVTNAIDSNISAGNIKKDVSILGVTGTFEGSPVASKLPQVIDKSITTLTADDLAEVTKIGYYAFYECRQLTSVTIPNNVTCMESNVFSFCTSLTSIAIPSSITSIPDSAFSGCFNLSSVTIPNSVTSLGTMCFCNCYALRNITLPSSVTNIGVFVFNSCSLLKEMTILATTPPVLSNTRAIPDETTTIYIPNGTLSAYQSATNWSSFSDKFVELP